MSFKDQLRDCFIGLWHDFWFVPPRNLLPALGYALWGVGLLVWRVQTVFHYPAWFHALSPLLDLAFFLLLIYSLYKKLRAFYDEKIR